MPSAFLIPVALLLASQEGAGVSATKAADANARLFEIELKNPDIVALAQARNVPLSVVVKRLEQLLQVPVTMASALAATRVSFRKVTNIPVTDLLVQMAPVAYVDSRESLGTDSKLLAVHFHEAGSAMPVPETAGIAIAGSTDERNGDGIASAESTELKAPPAEGPFLNVRRLPDGRLSIDARDQGLGVLLFEVAQACGARFDLRVPEAPLVSRISVNGILPSELPAQLGLPGVGVDVRRNLLTGEEVVLRFFVDPAP